MKRFLIICMLSVLLVLPVFADFVSNMQAGSDVVGTITKMSKEDYPYRVFSLYNIEKTVYKLPSDVDFDEFYNANKIGVWIPALSNLIIGFGTGSRMQYRETAGMIESTIDGTVLTIGASIAGTCLVVDLFLYPFVNPDGVFTEDDPFYMATLGAVYGALGIIALDHVISSVTALVYGYRFNNTLKNNIDIKMGYNPIENKVKFVGKVYLN